MRAREAEPFKILACLRTIPPKYLSGKIKACIKRQNIGSGLFPQQAERKEIHNPSIRFIRCKMPGKSKGNAIHQKKPNRHWANSFGSINASCHYRFLPLCAARRVSRSPSTNHWLALINWTMLTNCLNAMTGAETPVIIHGKELSILLALASSKAPALQGLAKRLLGCGWAGFPGCADAGWASWTGCRREGERVGEENESR